jgi:hypothetical protein
MSEEITIEPNISKTEKKICSITSNVISNYLLAKQTKLTTQEKTTLESESIKILCDCVPATTQNPSTFNNTVLVFGYVQSGKTLSFEMVTALARDNEYKLVIIIAGRTNILLNQTTKRFKDDLEIKASNGNFKIFQNLGTNEDQLISNAIINPQKPTLIITVLKHQKYLNNLAELFSKHKLKSNFSNKGVIIIDDESDQASLNTLALANARSSKEEPNKFSAIYEGIKNLRQSFPNHSYIQYTATPQANLLIDYLDLLSPSAIHVLTPGTDYTGGATFFKDSYSTSSSLFYQHTITHWDNRIGKKLLYVREIPKGQVDSTGNYPEDEIYHPTVNDLSSPPNSLKEALRQFLIGAIVTIKIDKAEDYVSMLVHPTNIVKSHKKFKLWINSIIEQWLVDYIAIIDKKAKTNDFYNKMEKSFEDYCETCGLSIYFELIWENLFEIITNYKIHLVTGHELDLTNDVWEDHLCHILIGGTKLDRGFTVKNLICTYMPRYSKGRPNSDTIQQRCRFFGYKRNYLKSCRVFLPPDSINEYADYVEDEEMLRSYFKKYSLKDFYDGKHSMHLTPRLNATRHNILSSKIISNQYGGYKYFQPFGNFEFNNLIVKNFLSKLIPIGTIEYGETKHDVYITDLEFAYLNLIQSFKFVYPEDDIKVKNTALILESAEKRNKTKVYLLNMSQGEPRERGIKEYKFKEEDEEFSIVYRIKAFHQGKNDKYPGDGNLLRVDDKYKTEFGFDDDFIIQIHNFRPKDYFNNDFFSIAIYYPESLCTSLTALTN